FDPGRHSLARNVTQLDLAFSWQAAVAMGLVGQRSLGKHPGFSDLFRPGCAGAVARGIAFGAAARLASRRCPRGRHRALDPRLWNHAPVFRVPRGAERYRDVAVVRRAPSGPAPYGGTVLSARLCPGAQSERTLRPLARLSQGAA